jgi:hypothetical protein
MNNHVEIIAYMRQFLICFMFEESTVALISVFGQGGIHQILMLCCS